MTIKLVCVYSYQHDSRQSIGENRPNDQEQIKGNKVSEGELRG
jgi:hypothetical protein